MINEDLESIPKAGIYNTDTLLLGEADIDGRFQIEIPQQANELIFAWIGMEWTRIQLTNCDTLEVIMMYDYIYDFMTSNKIDRLRRKRFDKLPELHLMAVNNGLFVKKEPCYKLDFLPIKPELDEIGKRMEEIRIQNRMNFKRLSIGDTIRIPFSGSYRHDGTDRMTLRVFSIYSKGINYPCIINGVITDKNKSKRGYNLEYRVINCDECTYDSIVYQKKEIKIGDVFNHNMKYHKVMVD
ncbi:MAG: hypothetical protein MI922_21995 [Bacteroidales bacterium]|nr:hypothetical protein [Bacteroidales bacterium]